MRFLLSWLIRFTPARKLALESFQCIISSALLAVPRRRQGSSLINYTGTRSCRSVIFAIFLHPKAFFFYARFHIRFRISSSALFITSFAIVFLPFLSDMVQLSSLFGLLAISCLVTATPPASADRRDFTSINDDVAAANVLLPRTKHGDDSSTDFSSDIASGLSACSAGASSGSVDSSHKAALASWCKSSGSQYFSQDIVSKINSWCTSGAATATLSASTCDSIRSGLKSSHGSSWGSCNLWGWLGSFMSGGSAYVAADAGTQSAVQAFIGGGSGSAAAQVDSNTLGALKICGAGGGAASLNAKAKSDCKAFLSKPGCPLEAKVIAGVEAWLQGKGGSSGQHGYCSASGSSSTSAPASVSSASVGGGGGGSASATVSFSITQSIGISATATTTTFVVGPTPPPPAGPPPQCSSCSSSSNSETTTTTTLVGTTLSTAAVPSSTTVPASTSLVSEPTGPGLSPTATSTNSAFSSSTAPVASTSSVVPFTGAATRGRYHLFSSGGGGGVVSLLFAGGVLGWSYLALVS